MKWIFKPEFLYYLYRQWNVCFMPFGITFGKTRIMLVFAGFCLVWDKENDWNKFKGDPFKLFDHINKTWGAGV